MQNIFDTKVFKVLYKNKIDIREGWKGAGVAVPVFSLKTKNSYLYISGRLALLYSAILLLSSESGGTIS